MIRRLALVLVIVSLAWAGAGMSAEQGPTIDGRLLSGLSLRNIGPANMSGRVVDIAVVESDPYIFYVATATGGLWRTTDNGVSFTTVFQDEAVHSIGCVTLHQANPNVIWVGSGERANRQSSSWGDGVYKSVDAGKTWTNMGLRDSHHIGRIVLHPANADIVFVAAMGHLWGPNTERGLFKSTDGGKTWTNVLFVNEDTGVVDVAMDPSDPNIMYAAAYQRRRRAYGFHGGGPGSGLYKSTDGGQSWRPVTKDLPADDKGRIGISIYRQNPRIVYICVEQGFQYNASTAYGQRKAGVYRSEDKGESWEHMSDWNPRPMYASQILVDPSDDKRVYMVNAYSYSDDGGRTFTAPRQSLHGDDRIVWVNPKNSRHVIKGDDGGVGISYDRGLRWLFIASLPVSQYYRVAVDMQKPYWVYGGLQDNGSWGGPSATYFSSGILNEDWVRVGGGDGFKNLVDPRDNRTVYTASQFLGLSRFDMKTHERRDIRPDSRRGHIQARRNWETWGKPTIPEPLLGNAMAPANWDAPFILSPHDPSTIYAGTNVLWKSTDRGDTWGSLGNRTTGVDRGTLTIMGQTPNERTHSLDDGVPYYPTLTAIAESPLRRGLLYTGTDDGNVQVSMDDGKTWTNVATRLPGLPSASWVAGLEASRYHEGTVYAAFDNHASDDYGNYLYKSADYGRTWTSVVGDLPPRRVIKAVHEDPKSARLLYIGTEFGFFLTIDGGQHWIELKNNLPRVAVNDFVIHPRDNDLVLATHGRGIWILDNVSSLQELTPQVLSAEAHLFSIEPAEMIRYSNPKAHAGDMIFRGENPPAGAIIDYHLRDVGSDVSLTVHDAGGAQIASLKAANARGVNRVAWNLRYPSLSAPAAAPAFGGEEDGRAAGIPGPFVMPGQYLVRLVVGGRTYEKPVMVGEDPRISVSPSDRKAWTETLLAVGGWYEATAGALAQVRRIDEQLARLPEDARATAAAAAGETRDLLKTLRELQSRLLVLYNGMRGITAPPTADQRAQLEYLPGVKKALDGRASTLVGTTIPALNITLAGRARIEVK